MPAIRVLYDISELGLGQIWANRRGGSYRADRHLTEFLSRSSDCELFFCANHSSLAYLGSREYLGAHSALRSVPLIAHQAPSTPRRLQSTMAFAHRQLKAVRGSRALPKWLRDGGRLLDGTLHRPVLDTTPPADIYHSSTAPLPSRQPRSRSPLRFITIYDLRATRYSESEPEVSFQRSLIRSVQKSDWVLTSSESTRNELCELGVAEPRRIIVLPLAADKATFHSCGHDDAHVRRRYGIPPSPYVLLLASASPRKNIARAIDAFKALIRQERGDDLMLVLAGDDGSRLVATRPELESRLIATGFVSDQDLAALYRGALAFVYPSLYEGFGLPPLEAMQCGTPVIASNRSSIPEVVGDAGLLVDPEDPDALAAAILDVSRDKRLRHVLREKGLERADGFSWERTTACILAAYRTALDG